MPPIAKRLLLVLRDAWLVVGAALAVMIAAELAYRVVASVRRPVAVPEGHQPGHPYAGAAWYDDFLAGIRQRVAIPDPYRAYRYQPLASRDLNTDSVGRITPQPPVRAGSPRIVLLGGSVLWGYPARDSFTIAALMAKDIATRGLGDAEIVNLAETGYNSMQEAAALRLELVSGRPVAAAVFLDGYNDAATALHLGSPGHTFVEHDAQTLNEIGRRSFMQSVAGLSRFSHLFQRLQALRTPPAAHKPSPDSLCGAAAAWYSEVQRSMRSETEARGVSLVVFLQPHISTTHKRLTAWETAIAHENHTACADSIAAHMAPESGRTFFDLRTAFDADTATVFVDDVHITEAANTRIASLIVDQLVVRKLSSFAPSPFPPRPVLPR